MKYFFLSVLMLLQHIVITGSTHNVGVHLNHHTSPPPVCGWDNLGAGLNGPVYAIANIGNQIYVGGNFTDAGGNPNADFIALWDGTAWQSLGSGLNDEVRSILIDSSNVYVGGQFTDAGGNPNADGISAWNGTSWSSLGLGISGIVNTIVKKNTEIYIGGYFMNAGGVPNANHIAMWDGAWNNVGPNPPNNEVFCIEFSMTYMFIGGSFTAIGTNTNAARIARWDGLSWSSLSTGVNNSVYTIRYYAYNNSLFIGGNFTDVGADPNADYMINWSILSQFWTTIPGFNGKVHSIILKDLEIYIGGAFTAAGGNYDANGIARIMMEKLQGGFGGGVTSGHVKALHFIGDDIFIGGQFVDVGGNPDVDNIGKFNILDAAIYTFNGAINDDYHNVSNWICGLNPTEKGYGTIFINAECQLGNQELNGTMIVQNGANMSVSGTLFIKLGGALENFGLIENNGDIITHYTLENHGIITNFGLMEFDTFSFFWCQPFSTFTNEIGSILNNKNFFSDIDNYGNFTVKSGSILNNNGGILNWGAMQIEGICNNSWLIATQRNLGITSSLGVANLTISGIFTNLIDGILINDSTAIMEITDTGKIDNNNYFRNEGFFYNRNILNNFPTALIENRGSMEHYSGSQVHNEGTLHNLDSASFKLLQNATLNNNSKLENYDKANLESDGSITNNSSIINKLGGIFKNQINGILHNKNMANFTQNGTLSNEGMTTNDGTWNNNGSTTNFDEFINKNLLNNTSSFSNSFAFLNIGTINNSKLIKNNALGSLTIGLTGVIINNGTGIIENEGTFENTGEVFNHANIINKLNWVSSGLIENNNSILNQFSIENSGSIINSSAFQNDGTFRNSNHIKNNPTGTITNQLGTIFNDTNGLLINEGTFNNYGDLLNHAVIRNKMNWVTTGTFENFDTLQNETDAIFDNKSTGLFYNRENAVIINENDAVFLNSTGSGFVWVENLSTILNHGLIVNDKSMTCSGQIIIYPSGNIINNHHFFYGQGFPLIIHLNGTFLNNVMGHFEGFQLLTITGEGLFNNEGEFIIIE